LLTKYTSDYAASQRDILPRGAKRDNGGTMMCSALKMLSWCGVMAGLIAGGLVAPAPSARAAGVLKVAMTAGDLPVTTGNPDQGFEGFRFVGWNLYDALINWDLSKSDRASDIKPGLATEWHIDPANHKRWIFTLRQGVKWHDGCDFTADDVVWNFQRISDQKAPQFFTQQFALSRAYLTNFESIEKIDDHSVAITTKFVESLFPYDMS
jgi:ABC-type transport system substrate-binding protein